MSTKWTKFDSILSTPLLNHIKSNQDIEDMAPIIVHKNLPLSIIYSVFFSLHCPIYYQVLDSPFIYYLCKIVSIQIRPKFLNLVCLTGLTFEKQLKILLSQQISNSFENE